MRSIGASSGSAAIAAASAPAPGTGTTIDVALQLAGVALVPLKLIVLVPWLDPKFDPLIVTEVPTSPLDGDNPLSVGVTPDDPPQEGMQSA